MEILTLDCKQKENRKWLINTFNELKEVKSKGYNFKDTFKNDINKFIDFQNNLLNKYGFEKRGISFQIRNQNVYMQYKKDSRFGVSVHSRTLEELYMKICIFVCYVNMEEQIKLLEESNLSNSKLIKRRKNKRDG